MQKRNSKKDDLIINLMLIGMGAVAGLFVAFMSYGKMMIMTTACKLSKTSGFMCDGANYAANHPGMYALVLGGTGAVAMLAWVSFVMRGR